MKKLKLPAFKTPFKEPKALSMTEYLKFVEFNLKYTSPRKISQKSKESFKVDVPFRLKK